MSDAIERLVYFMPETQDEMETILLEEVLGFCGCGQTHMVREQIHKALIQIDIMNKIGENLPAHAEWIEETEKILGNAGAAYLVYYVLDQNGLTEHGGSVPGWLTPFGKQVLNDLNALFPEIKKEQ